MGSLANALIGEYRVVGSLGAGGMGEVYKAVHTHLGRVIAIKVLSPELTDGPALERFYSEANIQASLQHPGVAEYLGFYEYQGRPCILMEYVDGETLAEILRRRGSLPAEEAAGILRQIAAVIAHFHAQGVVHRDLKASNVKITSTGQVKILDFGIARHQRSDRLTRVGAVVGTTEALAPEQVRGQPAVPATDVWQLGVMFYEMLTGRTPFHAETVPAIYGKILSGEYDPPPVPPGLACIIARCLEKDPARRFASAGELCAALAGGPAASAPAPAAPPKPRWRIAFAAAVVVLLAVGVVLVVTHDGGDHPVSEIVSPTPTPAPSPAPSPVLDTRAIIVDTMDGTAQVYRDGVLVGTTPYQVQARTGEKVDLVLRRDGFTDTPVQFEAAEPHVYTYTLQPLKGH
jgi:serine/threonine protein kinase